ncbi:PTS system IIA component, Gat family [Alkalispirochaeta americana]|uniref:PTS system IIA component, Gat family n=1 Tax=Alkalispirochaeta americana TaxID=159291 RepID=A0A1N6R1X4_9SPIO|nr:PTS sugar transporter subunit IIA [Alkalispirochaeta americana]SIQ22851.1 PTS system IIA component, Gat family [Alkalispirochaeta americana]
MRNVLSDFQGMLKPSLVLDDLAGDSREEILRTMAEYLVKEGRCRRTFVEAILARERLYPSGLPLEGPKIAIPHTDTIHVHRSALLFVRLRTPVEFASMGDPKVTFPVQLVSMFALQNDDLVGNVLQTLITLYQRRQMLEDLLRSKDAREMYQILVSAVESCQEEARCN